MHGRLGSSYSLSMQSLRSPLSLLLVHSLLLLLLLSTRHSLAAGATSYSAPTASVPSTAAVSVSAVLDSDGSVWLSGRRYLFTPQSTLADTAASSTAPNTTLTATTTVPATSITATSTSAPLTTGVAAEPDAGCADSLIPPSSGTFWVYVSACLCLVLCGGLVSGLTIGLFSLSNLELEVLQEDMEADAADRHRAKRLKPLLKEERHHLLLVTLLLTNTAAMEALPEMLDKLVPEWAAVLISVSLVLLFSEIIPQSICTRAPLTVGAFFSPLVWLLMLVLFPVSWPIAKLLDLCIGKEGGNQFLASRSQVTSLLEIIKRHNILTDDEAKIMQTVVQLRNKQIKDVMIPPDDIYMVTLPHHYHSSPHSRLHTPHSAD